MKKLIALLLAVMLCFSMAACGDKNSPSAALEADIENSKSAPDDIVEELTSSFGEEAGEAFAEKMLDFDYKLGEEKIDGDTATVETTITTYPFGELFTDVLTEYITKAMSDTDMTEEEGTELLGDLMIDALDSADKSYETVVSIKLVKENDQWVVQEDQEMANALTGGIYDMASNFG